MKILYLAEEEGFNQKHFDHFSGSLTEGQSIVIYAPDKPDEPQFEGVGFVMDPGGAFGTVERIDAAKAANVELWQVTTTGLDDVNVACFLEKGMTFAHSPGTLSGVPLAEHALMWILSFAKNVVSNNSSRIAKALDGPLFGINTPRVICQEMEGLTLGLIGFGASARELARRAWPLGMRIMAIDVIEFPQEELDEFHVEFLGNPSQIDTVLSSSDYVSLHLHLNSKTRHTMSAHEFEMMKQSAVLINIARGALVDEVALVQALRTGAIRGAGLDVFEEEPPPVDHPLLEMENVLTTAHSAAYTPQTSERRLVHAAENANRVARGVAALDVVESLYL